MIRLISPVEYRVPPWAKELVVDVDGKPVFKAYTASAWEEGHNIRWIKSPIDGSTIAGVYAPSWSQVDSALEKIYREGRRAARNIPGERRLAIISRIADLMEQYKEDIAQALVVNAGKPVKAAHGEVEASIDRLRRAPLDLKKLHGDYIPGDWDAHTLESEGLVRREPYGVVLSIIPFNYPLFDTVNKFTYSFLPGNAFIVKPPSADPIPIFYFVKLALEAGVPPSSIALLPLPGRESGRLVGDRRIHVISLTGSTETGVKVIREAGIKQFIMELGGGDPAIVLDDADLDLAASKIATGIVSYSGQRCDSIKLILVEEPVYEEMKKRLVEELAKARIGDPRDPSTVMGPLIDEVTADEVIEAAREAEEAGGKVLYGGRKLGPNYIEPTLVEVKDKEVLRRLRVFRDEIFASIAVITPVSGVDEAIELANERRYGLDAAIFGRDINKIRKLIRLLEVGAIYINEYPRHGIGYYPFGGRKDSGIGMEGIGYSIEYVTARKTIVYNYKGKGIWEYM
ncbi:MAG: aldehyde dehydrogenase family protein [Desulfurococcales archaeon]|nr:aldehyde dehydrogenase family protein [Desulfurococcales archaeon]